MLVKGATDCNGTALYNAYSIAVILNSQTDSPIFHSQVSHWVSVVSILDINKQVIVGAHYTLEQRLQQNQEVTASHWLMK